MRKKFKLLALSATKRSGISRLVLRSRWRRNRLLILGYHGFSQNDEHLWDPALYMTPDCFRTRLEDLGTYACQVLPLTEALHRLYTGELPERSVALTIDDGTYDAYSVAFPILKEFRYPATVYLTTYYSDYQRPVFDGMLSYLLWKGRGKTLAFPEVLPRPLTLDDSSAQTAARAIASHALHTALSARDKDALLSLLAGRLDVDYEALCRHRVIYVMTAEEARQLAQDGFDIQLHTHHHRVSRRHARMEREIEDNQLRVSSIRGSRASHFCYPGGLHLPEFEEVLAHCGIESAVTCRPGIATRTTHPLRLPRLIDGSLLTRTEFMAWLSGEAALLPRRKTAPAEGQLVD